MSVITRNLAGPVPVEKPEDSKVLDEENTKPQEPPIWMEFSKKYPKLAEAFIASVQEQIELLASKMLDYGTGNMKAGTNLATEEEVKFALEGVWFRLNDKVQRWRNMIFTGQEPNNESLYDTFMDIANYAIIAKLISRGLWDDK